MNVKQATVEDIAALQTLFREAVEWQEAKGVPTFASFPDSFFAEEIRKGAVFVAEAGEEVIGTVSLYEADDFLWDHDSAPALYIHRLVSRRGVEGRGVGAALVEWSRRKAAAMGKEWLRVDCWADNEELCRFYDRQGFIRVRVKDTGDNQDLPAHYQNILLQLFQMPPA